MSPFQFKGIITALATPFHRGALDTSSFKKLLEHQLKNGVQGFVVGGTTGESPTLSTSELRELVKIAQGEVGKKIPIIVGTGTNSTHKTIENTRAAADLGADAALVVVPYYNKPPQRGMVEHFKAVRAASPIPIILYNVPGRTIASLSPESVAELSQVEGIVGIKEAAGDMKIAKKMMELAKRNFVFLSGDDGTFLDFTELGGHGVISVSSHVICRQMRDLFEQVKHGDKKAKSEYKRYDRLMKLLSVEANPIPVKMALHQMGIFSSPELRLPLVKLDEIHTNAMYTELKELQII